MPPLTSFSGFANWLIKFKIYMFRTSNQTDTGHKVHYTCTEICLASFPHYITDERLSFVNDGVYIVENSNAYLWEVSKRLKSMHEPWLSCFMVKYRIL